MDRAGAVEFPGEVHAHAACRLLHLLEVFLLLFAFELVFRCQQMDGHLLIRSLMLDHGLQKFHEVAHCSQGCSNSHGSHHIQFARGRICRFDGAGN